MTTKISEVWNMWRKSGIIKSDENLLEMMQNICDAYKLLNSIDQNYYKLVTDRLSQDLYSLQLIAYARNINIFPTIKI